MEQIALADPTVCTQPLDSSITSGRNFHMVDPFLGFDVILEVFHLAIITFSLSTEGEDTQEYARSCHESSHVSVMYLPHHIM